MMCAEQETFQLLDVLLGEMSPLLRQAFTMTYYEEMSNEEAGALLGVTTGTFKPRVRQFLDRVAEPEVSGELDSHVEILPGTPQAPRAVSGALLASQKYVDFNALTAELNDLNPQAQALLRNLNDRASEVKETIARVNDLLGPQNRFNLAATLAGTRSMIEESRPQVKATLQNVNALTQKMQPLLEDFRKTPDQANRALTHIDAMVGENRADLRQAVVELRRTLTNMTEASSRIDQTLDANSENIDEVLDNMRHVTENLKEFTATIKTRPYTLIRSTNPRQHKPGEQQ